MCCTLSRCPLAGLVSTCHERCLTSTTSTSSTGLAEENMTLGERKALVAGAAAPPGIFSMAFENVRVLTPRLQEVAESINPAGHYWVVPLALDTCIVSKCTPLVDEPTVRHHWLHALGAFPVRGRTLDHAHLAAGEAAASPRAKLLHCRLECCQVSWKNIRRQPDLALGRIT